MIFEGKKWQTRRPTGKYVLGRTYAVQAHRGAPADPRGRIRIIQKWVETKQQLLPISENDAIAEGGYTPQEYEELYERMYPGWKVRYGYHFEVVS